MNTGPADTTRSPHLDLEDLIAEAAGPRAGVRVTEHLASCEQCRTEANRWSVVSAGVRGLVAETPAAAQSARHRPLRTRVLPGHGRRATLAVSAAAALVLLAGVGYGASSFVHISFGSGGAGAQTVLTAVGGCPVLEQTSGALQQVNGSSLLVKTASGQPVTVTTTAATKVGLGGAHGVLGADITGGAPVTVAGSSSGGTIAASLVVVGNSARTHPPAGLATVTGTVSDPSTAGFTVVESDGTRVPVSTSSETVVSVTDASLGQLPAGATIVAIGHAGPHGTLAAQGVSAVVQLPQGGPQLHVQMHVRVKNCSPAAIEDALAFGG